MYVSIVTATFQITGNKGVVVNKNLLEFRTAWNSVIVYVSTHPLNSCEKTNPDKQKNRRLCFWRSWLCNKATPLAGGIRNVNINMSVVGLHALKSHVIFKFKLYSKVVTLWNLVKFFKVSLRTSVHNWFASKPRKQRRHAFTMNMHDKY